MHIITDAAVLLRSPQKLVTVQYNEGLNLTCEGDGKPQPSITWTRNDNPKVIGTNSKLELSPAESLPGNYTCTVSNGIGSASTVSTVTVLGKSHSFVYCLHLFFLF